MIKHVAILFAIFILVQSQRPPYAGSSKPYPGVLPQYLDAQAATVSTAATGVATNARTNTTVANRLDADNTTRSETTMTSTTTSSTIPPDLPVDALGDVDLVNRIKTWPREKQPFWFINWQQIQEHRGDTKNRAQPPQVEPNTRSFFAG